MSKEKAIDYSDLIKEATEKIDGNSRNKLNSIQKSLLKELSKKLPPLLKNFLEKTIEIALIDEGYNNKKTSGDLIEQAYKDHNFQSSINSFGPLTELFKMTQNAVLAISNLSTVELNNLSHWLRKISPAEGKKIVAEYENIGKELVPLLAIIIENAYKITKTSTVPGVGTVEESLTNDTNINPGKIEDKSVIGDIGDS